MKYYKLMLSTTVVLVCIGAVMARAGEQADDILKATGVQGGLIVHVGCGDGELTAELQAHKSLVVHGLDTDETNVQKARKHIAAKGRYGAVSVGKWDGERLPYTDNLARQTHTKALVYQGLAPSSQGSSLQHADALRCCACHLAA